MITCIVKWLDTAKLFLRKYVFLLGSKLPPRSTTPDGEWPVDLLKFIFKNDHIYFKMPRIRNPRVSAPMRTLGVPSDKYNMNIALTIIRSMHPDIKITRVVIRPDKPAVVEIRGSRDDIAQFESSYNLKLSERLTIENPDMNYDTLKDLIENGVGTDEQE
jgi:hypothetical protein